MTKAERASLKRLDEEILSAAVRLQSALIGRAAIDLDSTRQLVEEVCTALRLAIGARGQVQSPSE